MIALSEATAEAPFLSTEQDRLGHLPPGWIVLPGRMLRGLPCQSRPPERRAVVLHPAFGVVVIDLLLPGAPPVGLVEAATTAARLRHRLDLACFGSVFPGYLPVQHLGLAESELAHLRAMIEAAIASQPPLAMPPGGTWTGAVARALTTQPSQAMPPEEVAEPEVAGDPMRGLRWRFAAGAALGVAAAVAMALNLQPIGELPVEPPMAAAETRAAPVDMLAGIGQAEAAAPGAVLRVRANALATGTDRPATAAESSPPAGLPAAPPAPLPVVLALAEPIEAPRISPAAATPALPEPPPGRDEQRESGPAPVGATSRLEGAIEESDMLLVGDLSAEPLPESATRPAANAPRPAEPIDEPDMLLAGDLAAEPSPTVPAAPAASPAGEAPVPAGRSEDPPAVRTGDAAGMPPPATSAGAPPIPEPEAPRLGQLAPEPQPPVATNDRIEEPDPLRARDLAAEPGPAAATAAAAVPEREGPRVGDLAAEPRPAVTPADRIGEPDTARPGDLAAEPAPVPAPAAAAAPAPIVEPDALRAGDLAAEPQRAPVEAPAPLPERDAPRLGSLAAEPQASGPAPSPAAPIATPAAPPAEPPPTAVARVLPPPPATPPATAPAAARPARIEPRLLELLLARGEDMLARGDVSGARLMFRRAAEGGSAQAATALARSYEADQLSRIGARGIQPDPAQAAAWHRRAAELRATP